MNHLLSTPQANRIALPLPPQSLFETADMDVYVRFMRHLRCVPNSKEDIKILSAIQFTSDMMDYSDAHIAKILVDLGLRAPRMAFPADFLTFVDAALMRSDWEVGGASTALRELKDHWDAIGEDKFAAFRREYDVLTEGTFA